MKPITIALQIWYSFLFLVQDFIFQYKAEEEYSSLSSGVPLSVKNFF